VRSRAWQEVAHKTKHETAMSGRPWYMDLFGEDYLRVWAPILPPERTALELEGIVKFLNLPAGSTVLDLCCGHGRHAIPLAQRGYRITGQDLSEVFLRRAEADARSQGVEVRWVHSDMRTIPFQNEFDAVINIFTSFGYFDRDEENQLVLNQVSKALKPGGVFLMEAAHREGMVRRFTPHSIMRHDDGLISLEERQIDLVAGRSETRLTLLHAEGRRTEHRYVVRLYTLTELIAMLEAAGLHLQAPYGGLDGSTLTLDSRRLVTLSRKS